MTREKIKRLLSDPETATLERKLECHAFCGDPTSNAELVKDLCALANNGYRQSHLVIGVSDDGSELKAVRNKALTDDNLQDLVRGSIYPVPRTRLIDAIGNEGSIAVPIKIISVGPNKRAAYRISRDLNGTKGRLVHRANEVWVRRGATCELAAPETIARLVAGEDVISSHAGPGVVYARLPDGERLQAFVDDLVAVNPDFVVDSEEDLVRFAISGMPFLCRLFVTPGVPSWMDNVTYVDNVWAFEHGVVIASPEPFPKRFFEVNRWMGSFLLASSRERWGYYVLLRVPGSGRHVRGDDLYSGRFAGRALRNGEPSLHLPVFIVAGAKDTASLSRSVRHLLDSVAKDPFAATLDGFRRDLNEALRLVDQTGEVLITPRREGGSLPLSEPQLAEDILDETRFGSWVVRRDRGQAYLDAARYMLRASNVGLQDPLPGGRVPASRLVMESEGGPPLRGRVIYRDARD